MTDIRDNPPPLPEPDVEPLSRKWRYSEDAMRQIEVAAFARGVAAGQAKLDAAEIALQVLEKEFDELRAKLQALEEQKPAAWMDEFGNPFPLAARRGAASWINEHQKCWTALYLAAGAKHE